MHLMKAMPCQSHSDGILDFFARHLALLSIAEELKDFFLRQSLLTNEDMIEIAFPLV